MTSFAFLDPQSLIKIGEFFAAGLCELNGEPPLVRYSRAYRRWFENCPLNDYMGEALYPAGKWMAGDRAVLAPNYSFTLSWNEENFTRKMSLLLQQAGEIVATGGLVRTTAGMQINSEMESGAAQQNVLVDLRRLYEHEESLIDKIHTVHTIGGRGYTHSIVNYGRVLKEGLSAYSQGIRGAMAQSIENSGGVLSGDSARISTGGSGDDSHANSQEDFYRAMLDLLEGIASWHRHLLEHLEQSNSHSGNRHRLIAAMRQVPFGPARNFYEAMVAYNLIYYLDGCDNPGRMDQVLYPYFVKDATINHDQALDLMRDFFENVSANGGWSLAIGGSQADGSPAYQEMTEICLQAAHYHYRPSIELKVRPDMPDRIWELAMESLSTGCGQPAFYNEPQYLDALRSLIPEIQAEDLVQWNGGGCTETMLHGCSNVGSLDAGINLPLILESTLERMLVSDEVQFEQILLAYKNDLATTIHDVLEQLNEYFAARAEHRPQPVRSLLVDDCIERGVDFNDGGARYNWSVVNIAGLANVADALQALREVVFERREIIPSQLLAFLHQNFTGCEPLRQRLLSCAKFGNDLEPVDSLAAEIANLVYAGMLSHPCRRGGRFLPSHIMFETFGCAGKQVGASPDGRLAFEPLADSVGPVQGRDRSGPTAMLKSVTRLPLHLAAGTPVLNMRFAKGGLAKPASHRNLRSLVESYFQMGGMQIQVSVLDRAELLDALEHPERHEDLIVRIGGYSTYFNWLSEDLKQEVIARTEYLV